jgi:hypothetical protein
MNWSNRPVRPFWQFHLSTLIAVVLLLSGFIWMNTRVVDNGYFAMTKEYGFVRSYELGWPIPWYYCYKTIGAMGGSKPDFPVKDPNPPTPAQLLYDKEICNFPGDFIFLGICFNIVIVLFSTYALTVLCEFFIRRRNTLAGKPTQP